MDDDNDIIIEDDIVKAISFNVGIYGTTSILVDVANIFGKRALKKKQIKNNNWSTGNTRIMLEEIFVGSNKVIKCECSRNYSTD